MKKESITDKFIREWETQDLGMGVTIARAIQAIEARIALASTTKQYELQPDGTFVPLDGKQEIKVTLHTEPLDIESWTDTGKIYLSALAREMDRRIKGEYEKAHDKEVFEAGWRWAAATAIQRVQGFGSPIVFDRLEDVTLQVHIDAFWDKYQKSLQGKKPNAGNR